MTKDSNAKARALTFSIYDSYYSLYLFCKFHHAWIVNKQDSISLNYFNFTLLQA